MMTFATPISTPTQPHSADISENHMRMHIPEILEILLIDRTTSTSETIKNIIWANENYIAYGEQHYAATSPIKIDLITGEHTPHIMPRALKSQELQKERTKSKAEVFTPTWVVKIQNDALDENYADDDLETYIRRKWLEITCGEAPYMTTRYDMETGKLISLAERVGFIDRKLCRINQHIQDKAEWRRMAQNGNDRLSSQLWF
ncbi:hypothetical protein [Kingella kingae]|uniref:hypothetical protein n=1 Tax=Kingella kingae TaxID=504 RepID=UPI00041B9730|nr:hypothetical protein [Kingella kingae]MDK4530927.1 hypothetical protein [Kingella kingae]MDK4581338.1 hypothetical protein [Kingella kingae]